MTKVKKTTNNKVATKKDIQVLRSESKSTKKSLFGQMLKLEERVVKVEGKVDVVDGKLDKLQISIDSFIGRITNREDDNTVGADHTRELRVEVDNHEKRIKHLESQTSLA